jgi:hypothetical protein
MKDFSAKMFQRNETLARTARYVLTENEWMKRAHRPLSMDSISKPESPEKNLKLI